MNTHAVWFVRRCTAELVVLGMLMPAGLVTPAPGQAPLRAGLAVADITPDQPVQMSGYASRKGLSEGIHDRLYARAVALENSGKRLVLLSCDLVGFYNNTVEFFQRGIMDEFGLVPGELFLCGIHTHSGPTPTLDLEQGHPNNVAYTRALEAKLRQAVREALGRLVEVRTGVGVGYVSVGMNRRETRPDGGVRLGSNPNGPTDKQVLVLKVEDTAGQPLGALFHYACHATSLGPKNMVISGDVLGLAEQFVERILGHGVIAPILVGASGDVDPWFRVLPAINTEPGWMPEPVLLGTMLGEAVVHAWRSVTETRPGGDIRTAFSTITVPGKKRGQSLADDPTLTTTVNVTVARVGDVAFAGCSVEMLTEVGWALKAGSPLKQTLVVTHCNGASGYLPPAHLYKEGGYEVESSPFAPQAAEMVVREALRLLYSL